jgi:site-specific DNA recombinase
VLAEDLEDELQESEIERRSQERIIQRLKDERKKLLDGYYAGAIPVDLLKSEQDRITHGLADAENRLKRLAVKFDEITELPTERWRGATCTPLT